MLYMMREASRNKMVTIQWRLHVALTGPFSGKQGFELELPPGRRLSRSRVVLQNSPEYKTWCVVS